MGSNFVLLGGVSSTLITQVEAYNAIEHTWVSLGNLARVEETSAVEEMRVDEYLEKGLEGILEHKVLPTGRVSLSTVTFVQRQTP